MWAWLVKLFGGFIPFLTKPFGEWLGKIIFVAVISILFTSLATNLMNKLFPPKPSIINVAGDYNEEKRDVAGIGCNLWRVYLRTGVKPK